MSYQLKVIKDQPIGFWPLDETTGTVAIDYSGCGNNGSYQNGYTNGLMPLVSGGVQGSIIRDNTSISLPILNNYYGNSGYPAIADTNSLDNDFSLEVWFYPNIVSVDETVILADSNSEVGIYYEDGDIVFKFGQYITRYTLAHISKSHYIVASYSPSYINLYIDAVLVSTTAITEPVSLSESGLSLSIGPAPTGDTFIVDAPAAYRYELKPYQINSHYSDLESIPPFQVAFPDGGRIFEIYDNNISTAYSYSYPGNKPWNYLITDGLYYNSEEQYISVSKTTDSLPAIIELYDFISIPSGIEASSSKIEWNGTNGVDVFVSLDGVAYDPCVSGSQIPNFTLSDFSLETGIYLKIVISTSDSSKFIPRLYSLALSFYNDHILYSSNSPDYISAFGDTLFSLGGYRKPILSRDSRNGIRAFNDSGFYINTEEMIKSIEFFYTPTLINNGSLVSSVSGLGAASNYSWSSGTVSKTNIAAIYVNGINKTSETNTSQVFKEQSGLQHIVIVFSSPISEQIKFNHSSAGSSSSLYQNIALYTDELNSTKVSEHYNLYTERSISVSDDSSIQLTESAVSSYNYDWIVIQNV